MANPSRQGKPKVHRSEQDVQNSSFDEEFQVAAIELLAYNGNTGTLDRVQINNSGEILTNASLTGSGGDGAILDGASSSIKATVFDYTSSNPVAVRLTDTDGSYVGAGGGTQYTEGSTDASLTGTIAMAEVDDGLDTVASLLLDTNRNLKIAIADDGGIAQLYTINNASTGSELGPLAITVRKDTPANLSNTDGDFEALQVSSGLLWTRIRGLQTPNGDSVLDDTNDAVKTTVVSALPAGTNNIGDVDVLTLPSTVHSADFDTGAGTDTTLAFGLAVPASGGAAVVPGDATAGLKVDLGADNDVTVSGTVAVTQSGTWDEVGINDSGNSITVDAPVGTPVFVRLSDGSSAISTLPVSLASVPSHAVTNAGTFAVQVDGSALTALQLIDDTIIADDATFTVGTTKVSGAGFLADESSSDSVDEGDMGAARMTLDRKLITTVRPSATGEGLDIFRSLDLDESEEDVKTSAGKVYGWYMYNNASSVRYVKLYNDTAANVTVGSTAPVLTVPLPASSGANVEYTNGIPFSTAISAAATTGVADSDTGAPSANDVVVNIFYK